MNLHFLDNIQSPNTDRFMAFFGNFSALFAWLFQPGVLTAIGGAVVSLSTALYFIMRALHERQQMRHEEERHAREMERERENDMYG